MSIGTTNTIEIYNNKLLYWQDVSTDPVSILSWVDEMEWLTTYFISHMKMKSPALQNGSAEQAYRYSWLEP